ncbi:hypothetical protein [Flavobacterium sp. LAR06]
MKKISFIGSVVIILIGSAFAYYNKGRNVLVPTIAKLAKTKSVTNTA